MLYFNKRYVAFQAWLLLSFKIFLGCAFIGHSIVPVGLNPGLNLCQQITYVRRSEKIDEMSGNEFSCKMRECKLFCLYFFIAKPALKNHKKIN